MFGVLWLEGLRCDLLDRKPTSNYACVIVGVIYVCVVVNEDVPLCFVCWDAVVGPYCCV